ncbi:MAG: hypothetical protein EOP83_02440 [Verrucomicrobiaceae bacterium]|nr:MAG: hypothetical protein EOP83_02440 [Verrucomicrobiaceae bacterium]
MNRLFAYRDHTGTISFHTIVLTKNDPIVEYHGSWKRLLLTDEFKAWLKETGVDPKIIYEHDSITMIFGKTVDAFAYRMRWL